MRISEDMYVYNVYDFTGECVAKHISVTKFKEDFHTSVHPMDFADGKIKLNGVYEVEAVHFYDLPDDELKAISFSTWFSKQWSEARMILNPTLERGNLE